MNAAAPAATIGASRLDQQRLERLPELGRLLVGDLDLELVLKRVLEAGAS
jgi:hypothetical protein